MRKPGAGSVLIAGAGIGGLTAALSLHAAGISATVIERVREIRPLGVGINVQPQAVRTLIELGLGRELAATAIPTAEHVYLDRSGNPIFAEPRGLAAGYDWPQYAVHRGELQMLLLAAVRERLGTDAVRTGTRLERFDQTATTVRAYVFDRTTNSAQEIEADTLIGADGVHSTVRSQLHPDQGPLLWSGVRMWRGVTEGAAFLGGRSMIIVQDGSGVQFLAYPISQRALDRGHALINWVCQVPVSDPGPLTEDASWNRPGRTADVLPYYAGWAWSWLDVPGLITGSTEILEYPMVDRDPLPVWGRGRVTLLGDAAHPMYPVGANGASQAIIDARVLAAKLASATDPIAGLAGYDNARRGATAGVVLANREMHRAGNAAAVRAPDGLARSGELAAITATYRHITGRATQ
ncbi:MAG: flavin-dependent oxidoreductase [Pseudonocardiaceae bacterium]